MDNYNYPMGADTPDAPWNEVTLPEKEIEVTISVTLSKTVKLYVNDYIVDVDVDDSGYMYEDHDFSECDLHRAVEEQITLPHELATYTERMFDNSASLKAAGMPRHLKNAIADCKDWCVDDLEVIME